MGHKTVTAAALLALLTGCTSGASYQPPAGQKVYISQSMYSAFKDYQALIGSTRPGAFAISKSGRHYGGYYCEENVCQSGISWGQGALSRCEKYGEPCYIFAYSNDIKFEYEVDSQTAALSTDNQVKPPIVPLTQPQLPLSPTVPRGWYVDYEALMHEQMKHVGWTGVPVPVQQDVRNCLARMTVQNLTPVELEEMDSYARGETTESADRLILIKQRIQDREGGTDASLVASARRVCPDAIAAFEAYADVPGFQTVYIP